MLSKPLLSTKINLEKIDFNYEKKKNVNKHTHIKNKLISDINPTLK